MKRVMVVYDDTTKVESRLKTIIGNNSFGEIVLRRRKMKDYFIQELEKHNYDFIKINQIEALDKISYNDDYDIYCHILSSAAINNTEEFNNVLEKIKYVNEKTSIISSDIIEALIFPNKEIYIDFLKDYKIKQRLYCNDINNSINTTCFTDISKYDNLLMYISSGFDSRYFNSLQGDKYSITKKSKDKKKMKMEYTYYWLLPEEMKNWMVMPYNYIEKEDYSSYEMERMPMTDLAIRWTHKAIDYDEFKKILDKTFHFFSIRKSKKIDKKEYVDISDNLFIGKTKDRFKQLKQCKEYNKLNSLVANGTDYNDIEDIMNDYYELYDSICTQYHKKVKDYKLVIGHGDVFFANMLYSKEINLLRLIDPKGALKEEDLWTNPYYDVAKLSHSICGRYDFFNTNMYDIRIKNDMKFELEIDLDNSKYIEIFKEYLVEYGYDYRLVRLYEASLFLSMLPLHIDNPHKVFGFILNAIEILKEIKNDV